MVSKAVSWEGLLNYALGPNLTVFCSALLCDTKWCSVKENLFKLRFQVLLLWHNLLLDEHISKLILQSSNKDNRNKGKLGSSYALQLLGPERTGENWTVSLLEENKFICYGIWGQQGTFPTHGSMQCEEALILKVSLGVSQWEPQDSSNSICHSRFMGDRIRTVRTRLDPHTKITPPQMLRHFDICTNAQWHQVANAKQGDTRLHGEEENLLCSLHELFEHTLSILLLLL